MNWNYEIKKFSAILVLGIIVLAALVVFGLISLKSFVEHIPIWLLIDFVQEFYIVLGDVVGWLKNE